MPGSPGTLGTVELDLRGLLCPLTWARTKQSLTKLPTGHSLRVLLDHRPAVPDLRRNAEALGYEVTLARELDPASALWEMVLRRA